MSHNITSTEISNGLYDNDILSSEYKNKIYELENFDNSFKKSNSNVSYNVNPSARLSKYDYDSFKAGPRNAFQELSGQFEVSVNQINNQIDDYIQLAKVQRKAIEDAIEKDKNAHLLALNAANAVEDVYVESVDENNEPILVYSKSETEAARRAEYERVWEANCWKP